MYWHNEPSQWEHQGDVLQVTSDANTDFWHTTSYGYVRDNGHLYGELLPGDGTVSCWVDGHYRDQYDQAGVMAWVDPNHWLKTGVELFDGQLRLSTVVTIGYSSWAFSSLPDGTSTIGLRVQRINDAVEVNYSLDGEHYELASLVYLPPGREALVGAMCASPEGTGFPVSFRELTIEPA